MRLVPQLFAGFSGTNPEECFFMQIRDLARSASNEFRDEPRRFVDAGSDHAGCNQLATGDTKGIWTVEIREGNVQAYYRLFRTAFCFANRLVLMLFQISIRFGAPVSVLMRNQIVDDYSSHATDAVTG